MKKIKRKAQPICWTDARKQGFYNNLRDDKGEIRLRWLYTCTDKSDHKSHIRKDLLASSESCCAYCGKRITLEEMDVDHYLPKEAFEYLSYCWENYLPACKPCNQNKKRDYVPDSMKKLLLKDSVITSLPISYEKYNDQKILIKHTKRLLEPSFDEPSAHLDFDVLSHNYTPKTEIGKETNLIFFDNEENVKRFSAMSEAVENLLRGNHNDPLNYIQNHFIKPFGFEVYYLAYYEYWREFYL